jgi:hypothetical protein
VDEGLQAGGVCTAVAVKPEWLQGALFSYPEALRGRLILP